MLKQNYGSSANEVIAQVKAKMAELEETFPEGMQYEINYDVSKFLDASIEQVLHTLFEAFILVSLVVFIFLGDWRSSNSITGSSCILGGDIFLHASHWGKY